jgi:hypothetical protein
MGGGCNKCSAFESNNQPPLDTICCGNSANLLAALLGCVCQGACMAVCSANACSGSAPDQACLGCIEAADPGGCRNEAQACGADM